MLFRPSWYSNGPFGTGLLEVGEIPNPDSRGLGSNCFLSSFHRFSCCAQSRIVRLANTVQSNALLQTCMERGTLSSSRVVSLSFPSSLFLAGVPGPEAPGALRAEERLELISVSMDGAPAAGLGSPENGGGEAPAG